MARLFSVTLLVLCFGVIASAQPGPRIELVAELLSFSENSMFLRFADRTETWYHSSTFEVLGPDEYCGKSLTIYHEQAPEAGSAWRQVGDVFRLSASAELARDLFDPSHTFIAPAVEIVEEVGPDEIRKLRACGDQ
jgi:hypothetical protein